MVEMVVNAGQLHRNVAGTLIQVGGGGSGGIVNYMEWWSWWFWNSYY